MGCGCGTASNTPPSQPSIYLATRAALCQTCTHAARDNRHGATGCRISGRSIVALSVSADACPVGRHPDGSGIVRWMGMRWIGVPEPLRWRLVWALGREPRGLVGCGCLARLKASRAGPWLEPWLEGIQTLRTRLAGFMADWRDAMAIDAPLTPH
jgi:hypothetical protein